MDQSSASEFTSPRPNGSLSLAHLPLLARVARSSGMGLGTPRSTLWREPISGENAHSGANLKLDVFPVRRDDDAELRRILRQSPFGTRVGFTLEREPSFFDGEDSWGISTHTGVVGSRAIS